MRKKVERIAGMLSDALSAWDCVECVSLCEQAESDTLDPYFALVLDVYYRGSIPPAETRQTAFGNAGAFESAQSQPKDRFFLEDLPVRVEYKSIERFDEFLARESDLVWILRDSGTYPLYRIVHSQVLFSRSAWIDGMRKKLGSLPPGFWEELRESFQLKMEHSLADFGAATLRDDGCFFIISAAGFIRYAAAVLFMANRSFEPSHRLIDSSLRRLPRVPDDFFGRWESLVRIDSGLDKEKRYKIAELIAKSIIAFK